MFRVFVVGKTAYISEESDSNFRKLHQLRSQDVELIATYSSREALTSAQFNRALKQYNVSDVVDESTPPPKRIPNIYRDFPPEKIEQFRAQVSAKLKGKQVSEETRKKMADSKRGRASNNKGRKRSIIANIRQSEGMKGKRTVAGYITYSEPYSGKQVRLPPEVKPPEGYIKGHTPELTELRRRAVQRMWSKRRRRVDR
jgi:hypothetical protein